MNEYKWCNISNGFFRKPKVQIILIAENGMGQRVDTFGERMDMAVTDHVKIKNRIVTIT
jgi:hypothetical protein